jgi:hypothetical protein
MLFGSIFDAFLHGFWTVCACFVCLRVFGLSCLGILVSVCGLIGSLGFACFGLSIFLVHFAQKTPKIIIFLSFLILADFAHFSWILSVLHGFLVCFCSGLACSCVLLVCGGLCTPVSRWRIWVCLFVGHLCAFGVDLGVCWCARMPLERGTHRGGLVLPLWGFDFDL